MFCIIDMSQNNITCQLSDESSVFLALALSTSGILVHFIYFNVAQVLLSILLPYKYVRCNLWLVLWLRFKAAAWDPCNNGSGYVIKF